MFTSLCLIKITTWNIQIFTPHRSGAVARGEASSRIKVLQENMQLQSARISFSETRGTALRPSQRQRSGRRADGHTFEYGDGETNKHNSNYPPSPTERGETQLLSKINKPSCMAWKTNRVIGVGVCVRRRMQSKLPSRIKREKGGGEERK